MKRFRVTCYPNEDSVTNEVEAETVKGAIFIAEEMARFQTGYTATPEDVEELEEE